MCSSMTVSNHPYIAMELKTLITFLTTVSHNSGATPGKLLGVRIVVTAAEAPPSSAGWLITPRHSKLAETAEPATTTSEAAPAAPASAESAAAAGIQLIMFPEMIYLFAPDLAQATVMVSDYYQGKITGTPLAAVLAGSSSSTAISAQVTDTVDSSTATTSSDNVVDKQSASLQLGQLPALVLVCAHKRRDKRCGLAGPMLIDEFRRGVEAKGLSGQVHVIAVSHIGGTCCMSSGLCIR